MRACRGALQGRLSNGHGDEDEDDDDDNVNGVVHSPSPPSVCHSVMSHRYGAVTIASSRDDLR